MRSPLLFLLLLLPSLGIRADMPPIPPAGIEVPENVRAELTTQVGELGKEIEGLRTQLKRPELAARLPDVEIFYKAVDWALRYNEFFDPKQFETAKTLLNAGKERAEALKKGSTPWNDQTGLVVRGYRSVIDGSIQPYGVVVPEDWGQNRSKEYPLRVDFWFHGRGEKLSELAFIEDRMKNRGEFTPKQTFVIHLYGRFCNANKFAGERDLFETWFNFNQVYAGGSEAPENLVQSLLTHGARAGEMATVRGFSMGGASTWQFATHYPCRWAAAAPGAGFAETEEFMHLYAAGKEPPPWWEQVLFRWYDSTLYAANFKYLPVVAYSGEIDGQRQAANEMAAAMEKEGLSLTQVIGPQTGHKYHPDAKPKIDEFVDAAVAKSREHPETKVHLTTYTLIYNQCRYIKILGLEKQWERADIDAEMQGERQCNVTTHNISAFTVLARNPMAKDLYASRIDKVVVDGTELPALWSYDGFSYHKQNGKWTPGYTPIRGDQIEKNPAVCGPIDHALMEHFIMVRPTGKPLNDSAGAWAKSEMDHAIAFWRKVFRGDAPVKDDTAITAADLQNANLILWGDPSSNAVWKRMAEKLPLKWTAQTLEFAGHKFEGGNFAPILCYPNPLNRSRYVVLNSGVTFREQALLNNADETAKLPDWAVIDLRTPPGPKWPGLVVDAGFFDSEWKFQ